MNNLTKFQKAIILITIFWEIFVYNVNYNSFRNRLDFEGFVIASIPLILYWSIVWIWGFGTLKKVFGRFYNYIKSIKININIKYLIYLILGLILIYIANLYDLIDDKVIEEAVGGGIAAAILASLFFIFGNKGKKTEDDKKTEKKTSKNKSIVFLVLFFMVCFFMVKNDNYEQKRIKELNPELKRASTYIGWKLKETEIMYDFCHKNGYALKNYKNEFFKLTINEEAHLKQLYQKLRVNEIEKFEKMVQKSKEAIIPVVEKELQSYFEQIKIQNKNITIKDLCKNIDDNAKEVLIDIYENTIKRQYNGVYTESELQFMDKVVNDNNLKQKAE